MQMCRAVGVAMLGAQQFPRRSMRRHWVARGLDGAEPEPPIFIRIEPPPQIHLGLLRVLVLVKAGRESLPDINLDPLEAPVGVGDAALREQLRPWCGRTHDAPTVRRKRRIVAPKRAEQRGGGFRRAFPAVVHEDNEGGEPDRVGEENALLNESEMGISGPILSFCRS
jgi:hypothetical protein